MDHIISGIITELDEKLGVEINKKELCDENMVLFESFISELKTNVKKKNEKKKKCVVWQKNSALRSNVA